MLEMQKRSISSTRPAFSISFFQLLHQHPDLRWCQRRVKNRKTDEARLLGASPCSEAQEHVLFPAPLANSPSMTLPTHTPLPAGLFSLRLSASRAGWTCPAASPPNPAPGWLPPPSPPLCRGGQGFPSPSSGKDPHELCPVTHIPLFFV